MNDADYRLVEEIHESTDCEQLSKREIDQRDRLSDLSLRCLSEILLVSDQSDMSERNEFPSKNERSAFYALISRCYHMKNKTIPWSRYITPVHVSKKVNHGSFHDNTDSNDFIHAVLQFFISIEKCIEFPLTLPNHIFRSVFDNYGNYHLSSLEVIQQKFSEVSADRILNNGNDAIFFFKYFMSHTSIPDCMQFAVYNDISGDYKYYVDLSVSGLEVKEFPISLSDMMRYFLKFYLISWFYFYIMYISQL